MKLLEPVGRKDTRLWGNIRPLLLLSLAIIFPLVLMSLGTVIYSQKDLVSTDEIVKGLMQTAVVPGNGASEVA
jgi:hypothetical protein